MIELYTLGELKDNLRVAYGLDDDTNVNDMIVSKINEALKYICSKRVCRFNWLKTEDTIDVAAPTTGNITFTNGSRSATVNSGTVAVRQCIFYGDRRYLVVEATGTDLTIAPAFLGDSGSYDVDVVDIYFELPENFVAISTRDIVSDVNSSNLKYLDVQRFALLRNQLATPTGYRIYYTIVNDPISENKRKYMCIHPNFPEQNAIYYTYYRNPDKLIADSDEPPMEIEKRAVLLHTAGWFIGASTGHAEKTVWYRDMALDEINNLVKDHQEDDSVDFNTTSGLALDLSSTGDVDFTMDTDFSPVDI